jgi:PST family polysaccharide transporter
MLSWGSTLVVLHYLVPADYGLVGMALIYLGFAQVVSELGVGAAILQFRALTDDQTRQFNSVSIIAGAVCVLASLAAARPIGSFFEEPRLPTVIAVMSLNFLINAFKVVPQALMERQLQFKRLALLQGTRSILIAIASLSMAVLGFGYWTLALAPLIGATFYALTIVVLRPLGFAFPRLADIREPFTFSGHILASRFAWYGFSHADYAVISKALGSTALGVYTLGWTLSGMAVEKITVLVGRVTPAFFSAVQNDMQGMRRYFLLLTEGLSLVTFPASIGLALIAEEIVLLLIGEQWRAAILPVQLLAIVATFRSIQPLVPQVLASLRESRRTMNNTFMTVLVLPFGFYVGSMWGIGGVALAWLILYPVLVAPLLVRMFQMIGLSFRSYAGSLWPAVSSCVIMAGFVTLVDRAFAEGAPSYLSLIAKIMVGGATYALSLLLFHRRRVLVLRSMLRTVRNGPAQEAKPSRESPKVSLPSLGAA